MKEYRAKLKRQIIWMTAGILFSCMVIVICCVSAVQLGADEHEASFMRGFQSGLFFAWAAIAVYGIVVNVRALRDDKRLRHYTSRSMTSDYRPSRGSRDGRPTASVCSDF